MAGQRAIVLVTEGLNRDLVARWGPELLPNYHRLLAQGAGGVMNSEFVPYETSGLYTAFTGFGPAHHGAFSYWAIHSPDYTPAILDSTSQRLPMLWNRPEIGDLTTAVVNVFGTHPIKPVNGYTISYPMRASTHSCHPRNLPIQLAGAGIRPTHDVTIWFQGLPKAEAVPPVLRADEERARAALHLLDGGAGRKPDLTVLNITCIDRLSHIYWQELDRESPVAQHELAILQGYQVADRVLGQLLDRVDENTNLLVFSEMGFGPLRAYCSLNDILADAGLLVYAQDGRPDWARSRAFEAVQGCHGININLAGRYSHGVVEQSEHNSVAAEVTEVLLAQNNRLTGMPLIADVFAREKLYSGPALQDAPDLVVEPYDWRYLPVGDEFWVGRVRRRLHSGWHRRESFWGAVGPAFTPGVSRDAELTDVTPTILHMLGREPFDGLTGTPLGIATDPGPAPAWHAASAT